MLGFCPLSVCQKDGWELGLELGRAMNFSLLMTLDFLGQEKPETSHVHAKVHLTLCQNLGKPQNDTDNMTFSGSMVLVGQPLMTLL